MLLLSFPVLRIEEYYEGFIEDRVYRFARWCLKISSGYSSGKNSCFGQQLRNLVVKLLVKVPHFIRPLHLFSKKKKIKRVYYLS